MSVSPIFKMIFIKSFLYAIIDFASPVRDKISPDFNRGQ